MSEHRVDRVAALRAMQPEKPKHPLGWDCNTCFHAVKQTVHNVTQMKCCRFPPTAHPIMQNGQPVGSMQISPAVTAGDFCGEYAIVPPPLNA